MSQEVTNPGVAVEQQQAQNDHKNEHRQGSDDLLTHLTARTTFLISSSVAFLKSWSKGLASSLKSPTSSQFFRKRVGVGVWSAREETLEHRDGNVKHPSPLMEHSPAMITVSFRAGPNFRVISCLCLWTAKWSSFVNLYARFQKIQQV